MNAVDAAGGTGNVDPFGFTRDPLAPEWLMREARNGDSFLDMFGTIWIRIDPDARVRCRFEPARHHRNLLDAVHGGFTLAIVDQVLFLAPHARGLPGAIGGATLNVSAQFFAPLAIAPLDAVVEIMRETGRLIFMRGLIEQDATAAVAFSGTIRKATPRA